MIFIVSILSFLSGGIIGLAIEFDREAYYDYKFKSEELRLYYMEDKK